MPVDPTRKGIVEGEAFGFPVPGWWERGVPRAGRLVVTLLTPWRLWPWGGDRRRASTAADDGEGDGSGSGPDSADPQRR